MRLDKNLKRLFFLILVLFITVLYSDEKRENPIIPTISNSIREANGKSGETPSAKSSNPASKDEILKESSLEIENKEESKPTELKIDVELRFMAICVSIVAVLIPLSTLLLNWVFGKKIKKEFEIVTLKCDKRIGEIEKKLESDFKSKIEKKMLIEISDYLSKRINGFLDPLDKRLLQIQYVRNYYLVEITAMEQRSLVGKKQIDMNGIFHTQFEMGKVEIALAQVLSQDVEDIWTGLLQFRNLSKVYGVPQSLLNLIDLLEKQKRFQDNPFKIKGIIEEIKQVS